MNDVFATDLPPAPTHQTVADALRAARGQKGWTQAEVAAKLNFRLTQIEAIESGAYEQLPGATYVAGFIVSYARLVGLDGARLLEQLKQESTVLNPAPVSEMPFKVPEAAFPSAGFIWLGIGLVVVTLLLWRLLDRTPASEALPETAAVETGAETVQEVVVTDPPAEIPTETPAPVAEAATPTPAAVAVAPAPAPAPVAAPAPTEPAAAPASPPAAVEGAEPAASPTSIVVVAQQSSWIQIRDAKGAIVIAKLLNAGDSYSVPAGRSDLTLTTGNGGGTILKVGGKDSAPLGSDNQVVRNLPLDPARLTPPAN
jgi:cytoskeleton protein RodZ